MFPTVVNHVGTFIKFKKIVKTFMYLQLPVTACGKLQFQFGDVYVPAVKELLKRPGCWGGCI